MPRKVAVSIAVALVCLVCVAVAAASNGGSYSGSIKQATKHSLSFSVSNSHITKLTTNGDYLCADDSDSGVHKRKYKNLSIKVKSSGKFKYDFTDTQLNEIRFSGKIVADGSKYKASGKLHINFRSPNAGEEPDCSLSGADSNGDVKWSAKRN